MVAVVQAPPHCRASPCHSNTAQCPRPASLLLAAPQVVSVMVTAGIDMRNASIYIGSDSTSVLGNTLVAVSWRAGGAGLVQAWGVGGSSCAAAVRRGSASQTCAAAWAQLPVGRLLCVLDALIGMH